MSDIPDLDSLTESFRPIQVWDATSGEWTKGPWAERREWARSQGIDVDAAYRIEFYCIESPFIIVTHVRRNSSGRKIPGPPVITEVEVDSLPPRRIL